MAESTSESYSYSGADEEHINRALATVAEEQRDIQEFLTEGARLADANLRTTYNPLLQNYQDMMAAAAGMHQGNIREAQQTRIDALPQQLALRLGIPVEDAQALVPNMPMAKTPQFFYDALAAPELPQLETVLYENEIFNQQLAEDEQEYNIAERVAFQKGVGAEIDKWWEKEGLDERSYAKERYPHVTGARNQWRANEATWGSMPIDYGFAWLTPAQRGQLVLEEGLLNEPLPAPDSAVVSELAWRYGVSMEAAYYFLAYERFAEEQGLDADLSYDSTYTYASDY